MNLRSCTSLPNRKEQENCRLTFPPESCCAIYYSKNSCEAYDECKSCCVDNITREDTIKTLFSCTHGSISSKEFQEYIQKKLQNINLRR